MPTPYARPSWWSFSHEIRRRVHRARVPRPDLRGARRAARARARALRARAARDAGRRGDHGGRPGPARAPRRGRRGARKRRRRHDRLASARGRGRHVRRHHERPHAGNGSAPARRRAGVRDLRALRAQSSRRSSSGCEPRAVVVGLEQLHLVPDGALAYVVVGDREADRYAGALPPEVGRARALLREPARGRAADRRERRGSGGARACGAGAGRGGELRRRRRRRRLRRRTCSTVLLLRSRCGTRRAPATCSPPPTCGGIWKDCRSSSGCGGRSCTPPSPCGRPPGSPARSTSDELERALAELDPANMQTASAKEGA